MKKIILAIPGLLFFFVASAQEAASCCDVDAMNAYARNAVDKKFVASHDAPLPFHYQSANGKDINFPAADGKEAHGWEVKSAKPSNYYILVFHEWWGLNDYIKQVTEKLSSDLGINAIAVDLYDGKIATTADSAGKIMQSIDKTRAESIIKGAFNKVGPNAKVFTIGWCFGGGWSLQATLMGGKQSAGCVMYYGQPEKNVDRLKTLNADVLGLFGNLDQWPSPQMVDEFVVNMDKAGKKLIVKRYEATHAFANPSNPKYNKEATEDAYKNVMTFLKERIR